MSHTKKATIIATGLAMFSMFFGAGNVVFPLALGQLAQDQNFYAIIGLLVSAVGVPFLGLAAMTLFDGDYKEFFARIGKVPGFLFVLLLMGLIGPFGAIPRCVALSYSTAKTFLPGVSLLMFSLFSCVLIWLFTFRKNSIIDTLGYFLTPVLLASLGIIIAKSFMTDTVSPTNTMGSSELFWHGLHEGYQFMDLPGALFFSSMIIACMRATIVPTENKTWNIIMTTLKSSIIGASLLSLVYIGLSYAASIHSDMLAGIPVDELVSTLAIHIVGPSAAIVACIAVASACLTTAIALAAVFAEFIHNDLTMGKLNYQLSLLLTLVITFFVSTLNFMGIKAFLVPILIAVYPALITLSIMNLLYKLYGVKIVKLPVLIVLILTLLAQFVF